MCLSLAKRASLGLAALGRTLVSFEATFVLFLFAGIYKADPRFAWVPVDVTALFAAVSLAAGFGVILKRQLTFSRVTVRLVMISVVFASYMAVSLAWSPSSVYGPRKVLLTCTLLLWALAGAALIVAPDPVRVRRFADAIRLFALWVAFEVVVASQSSSPAALIMTLGGGYLGLSRVIGAGAILYLCAGLYFSSAGGERIANLAVTAILLTLMLIVGGRGPLLSLLFTLSVPVLIGMRMSSMHMVIVRRHSAIILAIGVAFTGAIGYLIWSGDTTFRTVRRLALLLTTGGGASAATRVSFYRTALSQWMESPLFGNGAGSWPVLALGLDVRGYPHNLILEVLAELGLVGLVLLSILIGYGISTSQSGARPRWTPISIMLVMLFINAALNAMVTGDVTDNRFLFTAIGLLSGVGIHRPPNDD